MLIGKIVSKLDLGIPYLKTNPYIVVFFSGLLDDVEMHCEFNCCSLIYCNFTLHLGAIKPRLPIYYHAISIKITGYRWMVQPPNSHDFTCKFMAFDPSAFLSDDGKKNQPRRHASHLSQGRRQREARADISFTSFALQGALTASMATGNGHFWSGNSMEQWETKWFAIVLPNSTAGGFE